MTAISDGSRSHDHCIVEDFRLDTSWMPGDVKRGLLDPVKKLEHAMETCSLTQGYHNNQTQHTDQAMTEFRQPLQVQSHLEMPRILVQLGHTQRT